jgi:hypothetical protein
MPDHRLPERIQIDDWPDHVSPTHFSAIAG